MGDYRECARQLLDSYDAYMAAADMDAESMEQFKAVCDAINFGAAAYDVGHGYQAGHAMGRAFLLALIDPSGPELDYLRASPASGEVARLAKSDLEAITVDHTKEQGDG